MFRDPSQTRTDIHTHAHTHTRSLGLLWMSDRPFNTLRRDRHPWCQRDSNPKPRQASYHRFRPRNISRWWNNRWLCGWWDTHKVFESFRHFAINDNPTSVHNTYTVIDRLPATDAFYRREKKNSRMRINVPSTSTMMDTSRAWFVYAGKIKVRYFLNRPRMLESMKGMNNWNKQV